MQLQKLLLEQTQAISQEIFNISAATVSHEVSMSDLKD